MRSLFFVLMIIKKVALENIRSYLNSEINFPEGSSLLAGNIGSGKTTVLMAINFALFGIKRGELSGASLLRNGAEKGKVTLHFNIEGKDVIISRSLKRSKNGVSQDNGHISINGEEKKATPIELKQEILNLLNYPKEALTKNDLLYKYTVYTSQEQMKQILTCDKEDRLNTLRKVFGIDKYKRISENARIIISRLKNKRKELAGYISDLEEKKEEKKQRLTEREKFDAGINALLPKIEDSNLKIKQRQEQVELFEKTLEQIRELKLQKNNSELNLKHYSQQKIKNGEEITRLIELIEKLNSEKLEIRENLQESIEKKKQEIVEIEESLDKIREKLQELKIKKQNSDLKKEKVSKLENCPTCFQKVSPEHKSSIIEEEENKLNAVMIQFEANEKKQKEILEFKEAKNKELERLREEEKDAILAKRKIEEIKEKTNQKNQLQQQKVELETKIKEEEGNLNQKTEELKKFEDVDEDFKKTKQELDNAKEEHRKLELQKAELETSKKMIESAIINLDKEIANKERARKNFEHITGMQDWINEQFIPLMGNMEKHIMFKVHEAFSSLFSKWFSMLLENETINVKLDHEFTPIIEQNGYETDYEFLSGGEKTAVALAYRLSLNQVINNLMSTINTRSLIILDEPTDGFSSEQLDKMRSVLDELDMKQVLIVSHEPKIETFVENIIRFEKNEHVSRAL